MFDRHQVEITVMQFRGHSLPVYQSMSVPWDFLTFPISSAKHAYAISSHNCHWNVSLPSGASLWNGKFGRVEGQNTTFALHHKITLAGTTMGENGGSVAANVKSREPFFVMFFLKTQKWHQSHFRRCQRSI